MKAQLSRVLPAAAAAALLPRACGSGDSDNVDEGPVPTVDPGDTDDSDEAGEGLRAPAPIEIARSGGSTDASLAAESASGDAATAGAAPSDMMIAPVPWITEFVVGDSMPPLPTNDVGYVYDNTATVTAEQVEQLAAALGVVGEAIRIDDGHQASWRVGPDDGGAPIVWVYEDAGLSWNYNSSWNDATARSTCAVSIDADGTQTEECDEPEPPVGVPSEAEAEARVRELLVELGEDPAALDFETFSDAWFVSVDVSAPLGSGQDLKRWNFGFGAEGVMQHAGGSLANPEPVGPYLLIDLDTAVTRLGDSWFGGSGGFGGGGIAVDLAVAEPAIAIAEAPPVDIAEAEVEPGGPDGETTPVEPMPVESLSVEPTPAEPMPIDPVAPEPVTVTLVDVEPDLWWAWDVDETVWLLPAYRFIGDDGGWYTVPAVTDEFMVRVEPPIGVPEPLPVDPAPEPMPAPEPVEPGPEPGQDPGVPIDSVMPDDGVVDAPEPIEDGAVVELNAMLPMPLEEYIERAAEYGFTTRVVVQDGEALAVTADYSESRVNVEVSGDTVVAFQSIG